MRPSPFAPGGKKPNWLDLAPGTALSLVKLDPRGREVARYPGEVMANVSPERWLVVRATWTYEPLDLNGLEFQAGDKMIEWFSPDQPFNAFAVHSSQGELRGWYANVTYPAWMHSAENGPELFWHDLYVDLVGLPGGAFMLRDEDELEASGLASRQPRLYAAIRQAVPEMLGRFRRHDPPFRPIEQPQSHNTQDFPVGGSEKGLSSK